MEETLGKRIARNRKRLGLTQDRLAELLGVTAQAVSKWENDQSCPDIGTLPKLAEIFGITTDELLGQKRTVEAQIEEDPEENGSIEVSLNSGKRSTLGLALWLLIAGCAAFFVSIRRGGIPVWTVLWTSALLTYGLFGLYPKFSAFRLGCALAGGYFLAGTCFSLPGIGWPVVLIVMGLLLLLRALQKQGHSFTIHPHKYIKVKGRTSDFHMNGDRFDCRTSFGERRNRVDLPLLRSGFAQCSFGELTVDLSGCREIAEDAQVEIECSFGELNVLVPTGCRVVSRVSTSFGAFNTTGQPDPDADRTLVLSGSVSFGEANLRFI